METPIHSSSLPINDLIVRDHLFDDDRWLDFVPVNFLRIDHHDALHRRKPDATLAVLAPGGLVVTTIAFTAQHSVCFSQRENLRLRALTCGDLIQFLPRDAIYAAQTAHPKVAEIIFLDVVNHVLAQTVLGRESEKAVFAAEHYPLPRPSGTLPPQ